MRSVWNCLASSMQCSSNGSCCLKSKSAWNWSRLGLLLERGAPGQSTLKSGLAISVTRSWYFCKMRCDSAISLASKSVTFLFHMERSSIQCKPKSLVAISQARPKSGVSSSLMTESLNGQLPAKACATLPSCVIAPAAVSDAMNSRRDGDMGVDPFTSHDNQWQLQVASRH